MVKALGEKVYFSIICSNKDHDGSSLFIEPDTWHPYINSKVFYASSEYLKVRNISKLIKQNNSKVLFINGLYSWYFNIIPLVRSRGFRKIISVRGMLHPGALSQKPLKKKIFFGLWKVFRLHKGCEFHATTVEERDFIEIVFGKNAKTWIAGNFPKVLDYQLPAEKEEGKLIMVSIALVSPMKNHLLVLQALKDVSANVEYLIYGPIKDAGYWKQCESSIAILPSNIKVSYKGEVIPPEIYKALQVAHLFILPSKSENFGHAIYEAMTAGKPVITSHQTPWNNLRELKAGINVSTEHTQEMTSAIEIFASMDNNTLLNWSRSTRDYALKAVDVELIKQQYIEMFRGDASNIQRS
jgi:glycosyltransferase involved in cell wall biosynthesis